MCQVVSSGLHYTREYKYSVLPLASTNLWNPVMALWAVAYGVWQIWSLGTKWPPGESLDACVHLLGCRLNIGHEKCTQRMCTSELCNSQLEIWKMIQKLPKVGFFSLFDLWLHCTLLLWGKNTRLSASFVKQFQPSSLHTQNVYNPPALSCLPEHLCPLAPMDQFPTFRLGTLKPPLNLSHAVRFQKLITHFYGEEKHLKKSTGSYAQIRNSERFCKFIKPYKYKMSCSEGQREHFLKPGKSPCK